MHQRRSLPLELRLPAVRLAVENSRVIVYGTAKVENARERLRERGTSLSPRIQTREREREDEYVLLLKPKRRLGPAPWRY